MGDELIVGADRIGIVVGVPSGGTLEAAE